MGKSTYLALDDSGAKLDYYYWKLVLNCGNNTTEPKYDIAIDVQNCSILHMGVND